MQFFLYQISEGKGIVGKIKQKKRSERYIAKICSRDWAWLGVIAFTKTRSQTKIGVIPRDSAWFDMARGLGSLVHYTPYARTSDIFWCSSVFGRTLASHWKHDHSVESNAGWNRASSKLVLGGWETYIVACSPQSYKGLGYIHWPAKQRIRCHGNTFTNTHCESFLTEHLPAFQKVVSLEFPGQFVHTKS